MAALFKQTCYYNFHKVEGFVWALPVTLVFIDGKENGNAIVFYTTRIYISWTVQMVFVPIIPSDLVKINYSPFYLSISQLIITIDHYDSITEVPPFRISK